MLPKVLCRSNTVPAKVLMFFSEIEKRNFSKTSIQNYPNPNSINWKKNRHTNQSNTIKDTEINAYIYSH